MVSSLEFPAIVLLCPLKVVKPEFVEDNPVFGAIFEAKHGDRVYFNGIMSEVRLWNTALSTSDIGQSLQGNEVGLLCWWRLQMLGE